MPLNTLRLNHQPSSHPNDRIVFIKPLVRPPSLQNDYKRAELVLKAIAAQCLPIMKQHHLSVTTLEEHEPNPEFIGRNFNNGEIVQLVIRSKSGAWLPLHVIQMVMMHELAHNTHMNHGKGFWQTRNVYAGQMRDLWSKGYTGEGLWGRGQSLEDLSEALGDNLVRSEELASLPLCGGTFRSRRKKRKAKGTDLTWQEKRDKRIEKKFGKSGEKLGEDEDARLVLEVGRKGPIGGKPRVAQSKRGRELRAAAALARFETNKQEVEEVAKKSESESDYEDPDDSKDDLKDNFGQTVLDAEGRSLVRVCENDGQHDIDAEREMQELADLSQGQGQAIAKDDDPLDKVDKLSEPHCVAPTQDEPGSYVESQSEKTQTKGQNNSAERDSGTSPSEFNDVILGSELEQNSISESQTQSGVSLVQCPMCTMSNNSMRLCCLACAHVLDVKKDPRHWKCRSDACKGSPYTNAGDCGVCGICGTTKSTPISKSQRGVPPSHSSGHIAYI